MSTLSKEQRVNEGAAAVEDVLSRWSPFPEEPYDMRAMRALLRLAAYENDHARAMNGEQPIRTSYPLPLPPVHRKTFRAVHDTYHTTQFFDQYTAPEWLTSVTTLPGSTMDGRWFWNDHVLTMRVGEMVRTSFHSITRLS